MTPLLFYLFISIFSFNFIYLIFFVTPELIFQKSSKGLKTVFFVTLFPDATSLALRANGLIEQVQGLPELDRRSLVWRYVNISGVAPLIVPVIEPQFVQLWLDVLEFNEIYAYQRESVRIQERRNRSLHTNFVRGWLPQDMKEDLGMCYLDDTSTLRNIEFDIRKEIIDQTVNDLLSESAESAFTLQNGLAIALLSTDPTIVPINVVPYDQVPQLTFLQKFANYIDDVARKLKSDATTNTQRFYLLFVISPPLFLCMVCVLCYLNLGLLSVQIYHRVVDTYKRVKTIGITSYNRLKSRILTLRWHIETHIDFFFSDIYNAIYFFFFLFCNMMWYTNRYMESQRLAFPSVNVLNQSLNLDYYNNYCEPDPPAYYYAEAQSNFDIARYEAAIFKDRQNSGIAKGGKMKKRKVLSSDRKEGYVFETTWKGKPVPRWLQMLTYEQVASLIGSLISFKNHKPRNSEEAKTIKDDLRTLNSIRLIWNTEAGDPMLKDYLLQKFANEPSPFRGVSEQSSTHVYYYDARMFISPFNYELFSESKKGKETLPPLLENGQGLVYNIVVGANSSSRMLTPQKIKSICRTMIKEKGASRDDLIELFHNKCYIWPHGKIPPPEDFPKLSWFIPFVNPDMLNVTSNDPKRFYAILRDLLFGLRDRICKFATVYHAVSKMTNAEKTRVFLKQKKLFIEYMRTPEIQKLFIAGWSTKDITDQVYTDNVMTFQDNIVKSDSNNAVKKRTAKQNTKDISKRRLAKYADCEPQSRGYFYDTPPNEYQLAGFKFWQLNLEENIKQYGPELRFCPHFTQIKSMALYYYHHGCDNEDFVRQFCPESVRKPSWQKFFNTKFKVVFQFVTTLTVLSKIWKFFSNEIDKTVDAFEDWKKFVTHGSIHDLKAESKIIALEIKSILTTLYYINRNQYSVALSHCSNILVTRPEIMMDFLSMFSKQSVAPTHNGVFTHKGQDYICEDLVRIKEIYEDDPEGFDFYVERTCKKVTAEQNSFVPDMLTSIFNIITENKLVDMDKEEMKQMANQYSYLNQRNRYYKERNEAIFRTLSVVCRTLFGVDPLDPDYTSFVRKVVDHIQQCNELALLPLCEIKDNQQREQFVRMWDEMTKTRSNPLMNAVPKMISYQFEQRYKELETRAKHMKASLIGYASRAEPVCILFIGPPATGKTTCMKYIQRSIIEQRHRRRGDVPGEYEELMSYIYDPTSEYFEGYDSQKLFFILNDIFIENDSKELSKQASLVMKLVDPSPHPLNMAFGDKGSVYNKSQYVFITTNYCDNGFDRTWNTIGMNQPEALLRRFHIVVYRDEKFDGNVDKVEYTIQHCPKFPQFKGRKLNVDQLAQFIEQHREYLVTISHSHERVPGEYLRKVEQRPLPRDMCVNDLMNNNDLILDAIPNSFGWAKTRSEDTLMSIVLDCIKLRIYSWSTSPYLNYFLGFLAIAVALILYKPLYEYLFPEEKEPQSKFYEKLTASTKEGKPKYRAVKRMVKVLDINGRGKPWRDKPLPQSDVHCEIEPQSSNDNFLLTLTKTLSKLIFSIEARCYNNDEIIYAETAQCIHVRDGFFSVPAHMLSRIMEFQYVTFSLLIDNKLYEFELPQMIIVEDTDVALFKIPVKCNIPIPLTKFLYSADMLPDIPQGTQMYLLTRDHDHHFAMRNMISRTADMPCLYGDPHRQFVIENPYSYTEPTRQGDSGGLIVIETKDGSAKVIGLHCAKLKGKPVGFALPICEDFYNDILNAPLETQSSGFPHKIDRTVSAQEAYVCPRNSKIKRTPLYGKFGPVKYFPVHLRPFVKDDITIDPYLVAVKKLHQEPFRMPEKIPEDTMDYLLHLYPRKPKPRLMTYDEVLNGVPGTTCRSISADTSAGVLNDFWKEYPQYKRLTKGKSPYVTRIKRDGQDAYDYNPDFLAWCQKQEEKLKRGERLFCLWGDTLKDERRTKEKVDAGKSRLFTTCPLDMLILVRRYFLDFVDCVQSQASTKPIAVGINNHSLEWRMLYQRLAKHKGSVVAGDFENYDGRLPSEAVLFAIAFINFWYNDEHSEIRKLLILEIINAYHIYGADIFSVFDGNPSGNPITSILNSLVNLIMAYVICAYILKLQLDQWEFVCYGDDNVFTFSDPDITWKTLAVHYEHLFGMKYTHSSKDLTYDVTDTLETVRFLGREMKPYNGLILAPLALDVIEDSMYWFSGKEKDMFPTMLDTFTSSQIEMMHHGQIKYNIWTDLVLARVREGVAAGTIPEAILTLYMERALPFGDRIAHFYNLRPGHPRSQVVEER